MMLLQQYCARLKLTGLPPPTSSGLAELQFAQRQHIPFENIDVLLGRGVNLDLSNIVSKLLLNRRGGYCFEQNLLLAHVLTAMRIPHRMALARVWLGSKAAPNLTHLALVAYVDEREWLVDSGFGGAYCPPIHLCHGTETASPDGSIYRLGYEPRFGWVLDRQVGDNIVRQYSFEVDDVSESDIEAANVWTSTHPNSRFKQHLIVNKITSSGRLSLLNEKFVNPDEVGRPISVVSSSQLYEILTREFELDIDKKDAIAIAGYCGIGIV